ncbi:carboxylesterase/lipase family protein [Gordonia sp. DT219]|uniref:carboxylesterase/lipase family protein n=1 Tax=Gordonia sp. DT219 TaxID=3416658 RepID=UPI003CE8377F
MSSSPGRPGSVTGSSPVVETTSGPYRGVHDGSLGVWKGMRYAAPPIGENRWRRARPVTAHTGIVDADHFGAVCPQARNPAIGLGSQVVMDEDCLFLNVWAPSARTDGPRPVIVWVHGGAYVFGSGSQPLYDGRRMALESGVVVVTINYRIGAFGFADLGSVIDGAETNAALSDVLAALTWVRDNISGFGGDPARVTLAGESAGRGIVTTLLTTPAARGLFHQAIAQSSPATAVVATERLTMVAERLDAAIPGDLRAAASQQFVDAGMAVFADVPQDNPGVLAFTVTVDGDLVARHPLDVYRSGDSHPVPLLIGSNRDESALFKYMKSPLMPIDVERIREMFGRLRAEQPDLGLPDERTVLAAYPRNAKAAGLGIARDLVFRMPTLWLADAHAALAPVHLYRFDWAPPMFRALRLGATHGTELAYTWGNLTTGRKDITYKLGGRKTGEKVARRMLGRWGAFVREGVPDADCGPDAASDPELAMPSWPAFTRSERRSLVIGARERVVTGLDDHLHTTWGEEILAFR